MEASSKRCLIVVDVQRDFCDDQPGASLGVAFGGEVACLIGDHLRTSIDTYQLLVLTGDWHVDPGAHFSDDPDYQETWPPHCVAETAGAAWHPQLDGALADIAGRVPTVVIRKGSHKAAYSGFEGFEQLDRRSLDDVLRGAGIDSLDIVGIATDYCVAATAADALDNGYEIRVLGALTAAVDTARGDARLAELAARGAVVEGAPPRA
ncbi:MAG: isochorismatase family protein [Ilumatobacteraceae bacterium]